MIKSPFRYPGGKSKLLPLIIPKINKEIYDNNISIFCDAFVGGGSVLLEMASNKNLSLIANDKDKDIYCFWKIISCNNESSINELCSLINCNPTIEMFYNVQNSIPKSEVESAFKALFLNRTTFSGINKERSSPIGGKEQKSKYKVNCRYNANKLIKKVLEINSLLKNRLIVHNLDVIDLFSQLNYCFIYLDPPYYKMGHQLYKEFMNEKEHQVLSDALKERKNWLLSYDNCDEINQLYANSNIEYIDAKYSINGFKTEWKKCKEVLIF